jgi:glycosyltransferase involved in cell wall biosynthesis
MNRRLKILLSAYACEPGKGSEPEVGWRWATSLAHHHDVTVVTRANNQAPLRCALANRPDPNPHLVFYDLPESVLRLKRRGMPVALYYLLWQIGVRWRMRHQLKTFDIIHHITFNSFRQPGFWWFSKKPVVLGPLGGGQICPRNFFPLMRGRRSAEAMRSLSVILSPALPHLWMSFAGARLILAANRDTQARIPSVFRRKVSRLLETGIPRERITEQPRTHAGPEVRLLWLGWFIQIKAPELALRAFALALKDCAVLRITMAGDGPLAPDLKQLAADLGVESSIDWPGRIPHDQVASLMAEHDIFMFTSLRDTSGNVLLEAMASGLPAITLRHQGAAEIATDETAVRVAPTSIEQTTVELSKAILKLANSAQLRMAMGEAGRTRIKEVFAWEKQAENLDQLYKQIAAGS